MRSACLIAALCCAPAQDADLFPLADGLSWTYAAREGRINLKVGEPGPTKEGPKRVVTCAAKDGGVFELTASDGGITRLIRTPQGIYQTTVDPANLILKLPPRKFDDWGKGERNNGKPRFTNHGPREIEVAGRKYVAWKVVETRFVNRGTIRVLRWYAPGVGLVSEESTHEIDAAGTTRTLELESFEKK